MKKFKFGLIGIFLISGFLLSPSVAADYIFRVPSFGLGSNTWASFHFYYSDGDMVIIQWFMVSGPESVDFMILDQANYSLFVNDSSFDTFYLNNNSFEGFVIYQDIPEDLYFLVFSNDQPGGINVGFQFSLVEADPNCNCTSNCDCNCTYTPAPSPSPATISGFVTLTFGLATIIAILVITRKAKVKKI